MTAQERIPQLRPWAFSLGGRIPAVLFRTITSRIPRQVGPDAGDKATANSLHLTFDDGPTESHVYEIADLLAAFSARATFFVNTNRLPANEQALKRLVDDGHEIGTHGHSHVDAWRASASQTMADLETSVEVLADRGLTPRWFRPPHGHVRPCHWRGLHQHGLRLALWDVMPCDFVRRSTPEGVFYNTVRMARPGSVVVLHDNASVAATGVTIEATRRLLQYYTEQGWRFQTLSGW